MKLVIDIPQKVKEAFDKASKDDINFCFYDYNSVIGKAIKYGTPLDDVRQEIKSMYHTVEFMDEFGSGYNYALDEIIEIIDKHIGKRNKDETDN